MGLNLNPILRQELANLDKDTESRKTAMKALKSYVKDLDSKAIPSFLAQVSETKETNSLSGEYTISLYEILARVHGPNIVPQIDTIMSTIVKTLASSAGSFPLQQACSKVIPAIARYGIDPTTMEEDKKRVIIHSLCKPLSDSLLCSQESLASGSALCLKSLVDCDNWRFASDEMVNKVCQNVVVALDANSNQTHLHMGLVMALAKHNPLIVEAYARLLIHTGIRILGFGVREGNSQKRLSAVQMLNFLMKCLDSRSIYSEVELIVKEMERCQSDQMAYVRGAAYEAMMTSKRIAGELEAKMEKKGSSRSVTGSNFSRRKCSPHSPDESLSPESRTLGGSFSGYDSPLESSPRSSCNFDGRSVNRKLWRTNGVVDISLKDGLFSGDTTVSDSPLVPYDQCDNGDNEFEGFVMGSVRNRRMQNTTPTSPQRQCCSRNMNAEDFNIYSTPRKLISSLQYPDDLDLDHSDIQSPMLSRQNTKLKKQSPTKAAETISSSSTVIYSEETTPQSQMIMSKKKKKNMRYAKLMFAISFFVVVLCTSVMMFNQDDDVGYYTVPT
ncbi:hypothetical protein Bca52824_002049 [Brassica carinata]|uniref:TORTIFOLIA1/SINE1-2 N-terminal domain-containing protein n=1 Tax=Brassica carinata TaxID=52824 RepID=A0A8X7WHE7_BRACI|nr:hypothetical protein Bca52824_002049 [Brassica carinata]